MTKHLDALQAAKGLYGIAHLIGFAPKNLAYIVYGIPDEAKYSEFSIAKKSGGTRKISSPIPKLKHVQSRLAEHLSKCLAEIEISEEVKESCTLSHGFKPNLSIATNAKNHLGRRWVFNTDLADFFPTINFGRVRGYFIKNKYFSLDQGTATLLAQIICHKNGLPQGAPTSPVVSNLIASNLDISLNRIARRHRCTYTRYADDITFSTNKKNFSEEIGSRLSNGVWIAGDELRYRVQRSGFLINPDKTRMQLRWSRQDVTGLVVNEKINIPREYVKAVRAMCDHYINGKIPFKKLQGAEESSKVNVTVNQIQGMLSHIFRIKGAEVDYKRPKDWKEAPAYLTTHRKFLDYTNFISQKIPTIICEGETDNIYIRCALRAFDKSYPNMISNDGRKQLLIKLYRYTRLSNVAHGLAGGTGDLKELIYSYHRRCEKMLNQKPQQPTILIVDNDQGSKGKQGVFAAGKAVSKASVIDGSKQFYHLIDNLYLVPTPLVPPATDSMIEDFLEPKVRAVKLNGKDLNLNEKTFDPSKNYSKVALAKNVVMKNSEKIDFSGYRPLLDAINLAIEDYRAKLSP